MCNTLAQNLTGECLSEDKLLRRERFFGGRRFCDS